MTESVEDSASFYFKNMIGDRTGTLHIGPNQVMDLLRPQIDLPFNVMVYEDGILGLANDTVVHGVTISLEGTLTYVENLTLHHGGRLELRRGGRTDVSSPIGHYQFDTIHIQNDGYIYAMSDPIADPGMEFYLRMLQVDGGGVFEGTHLYIEAENVTIDAGGSLTADGHGYSVEDGDSMFVNDTYRMGYHGIINYGQGFSSGSNSGSSGAGHGGSGGHGQSK